MPIIEQEVNGLAGLLSSILQISKDVPRDSFLWYRGVPDHRYDLIPKLLREGKAIDDVFERERRLLTRFRQRSVAYWPAGYPQNDWEHLFAMQHFGFLDSWIGARIYSWLHILP